MKKITTSLLLLSIVLIFVSCEKSNLDKENKLPEPMKIQLRGSEASMQKSDQAFAFDFFAKVFDEEQNDNDENFMVSPFSLSMALAMTWNGSAGDTKTAMQNTLGFEDWADEDVNKYFSKLKNAFQETDPSTKLSIANSIWTNQQVKIFPEFISLNKTYYNATVESVDFTNSATVGRINKWAADNTNNLIDKVLEKTKSDDLMYLLNAIYFKGIWVSEFDVKNTSKMNFTADNGSQVKVDMMHQEANFNYAHDETMQVVELPYGNKSFSMMVLLPKEDKNLEDVAHVLQQSDYWSNLKREFGNKKVDLFIPKFKTEYSKKLNDVLTDMGMGIAFEADKADFSRMSDRDAYISFVTQDTYIATDEVGTEAAAVTVVGIVETSAPVTESVVFKADKPFIYMIQENSSGSVLFMGAVKGF
ncbi:MAG TPA: serpin family protein [Dysgonamonadaceae bacterium]|nr:serpin family protein [Dysgonamonadaceae bacterium]